MKLYAVVYFPLYPLGRNGIIEIYTGRKQAVFRTSKFICSRSSARANQMGLCRVVRARFESRLSIRYLGDRCSL